jgi:hypothetical protein
MCGAYFLEKIMYQYDIVSPKMLNGSTRSFIRLIIQYCVFHALVAGGSKQKFKLY